MPEPLHRVLRVRAAQRGLTLSGYLLREITKIAERPTLEDVLARVRQRRPVRLSTDPARAVRAEREAR